jgi:hypothetical protein
VSAHGVAAQSESHGGNDADRAALEVARRQLEASHSTVEERLALAEVCFRLAVLPGTDPEAAIELVRQATLHDPYHPKLFFHLGRLLHKEGDPYGAILEYRRAHRLAPKSHRILVHTALALNEIGGDARDLALRMFAGLSAGDDDHLAASMSELDRLVEAKADTHRASRPARRRADPTTANASEDGCRWRGLWKLLLLQQIVRTSQAKKVGQHLDRGKKLIDGTHGVAEYAVACLFPVLDGPASCKQLEARLRDPRLAAELDRPAIKLLRAVCELGAAPNAEEFVARASAMLVAEELPSELVCCLHRCWYGEGSADPVAAARLLDRYPEHVRSLEHFRELRIAILDHHARAAWTAERLDRAQVLWQETVTDDPLRIAVAHNLALVATRMQARDKYESAWERATELRYLLAAAARDVLVQLDDRISLHRSFAQQSRLRYIRNDTPGAAPPSDREIEAWTADREAFGLWLREWELAYLNARLRFRSPLHVLLLSRDCSEEDADVAREGLLRQFRRCLEGRCWAGGLTFLQLVDDVTTAASAAAKNPVECNRDRHFEPESAEADRSSKDAAEHGFLLFRIVQMACRPSAPSTLRRAGVEATRYLLHMPWRFLEVYCKRTGMVAQDTRLSKVFASYVGQLFLGTDDSDALDSERDVKLAALDDLIVALPESPELRLVRCRLLLSAERHRDAYDAAIDALPLTSKIADQEEAHRLKGQFLICMDNAALAQVPKHLFASALTSMEPLLAETRRVLEQFPKASGLRLQMADLLIRIADDDAKRLVDARTLLQEGLEHMLSEEQLREARALLERAGSRSKALDAIARVRALLEAASQRARDAMTALPHTREARSPAAVRATRDALEASIAEATQAEQIATDAQLPAVAAQSRELAADLRKSLEDLERM